LLQSIASPRTASHLSRESLRRSTLRYLRLIPTPLRLDIDRRHGPTYFSASSSSQSRLKRPCCSPGSGQRGADPNTVLCLGPGSHCHLEILLGDGCSVQVPTRRPSAPRLPDGCPRGSRDFRVSVDTHHTNDGPVLAGVTIRPFRASATVPVLSRTGSSLARVPEASALPLSSVVLRC